MSTSSTHESAPTIDLTPTWGEIGRLVIVLALSKEVKALEKMRPEIAKAFAMAETIVQLRATFTDEQNSIFSKVLAEELTKLGY